MSTQKERLSYIIKLPKTLNRLTVTNRTNPWMQDLEAPTGGVL